MNVPFSEFERNIRLRKSFWGRLRLWLASFFQRHRCPRCGVGYDSVHYCIRTFNG